MQRGELDRDAGPVGQGPIIGSAADGFNRTGIGIEIALGIIGGARAFAEHVKRIARSIRRMRLCPRKCCFDGLAKHEVAAHQPHRLPGRGAYRRDAQPFRQTPDRSFRGLAGLDHPRRHPQRPCRRIDQERTGFRLVVHEVALAELVLDELVGGAGVRHAQQGFGQHHQRQAFFGGEREFAKHVLDAAEAVVIGANGLDQTRGGAVDPRILLPAHVSGFQKAWRDNAVVRRVRRPERRKK